MTTSEEWAERLSGYVPNDEPRLKQKYKIRWNAGFGETSTIIEAASKREAIAEAYAMALDQFESNATWSAEYFVSEDAGVSNETSSVGGLERP